MIQQTVDIRKCLGTATAHRVISETFHYVYHIYVVTEIFNFFENTEGFPTTCGRAGRMLHMKSCGLYEIMARLDKPQKHTACSL
jgi:hypothetical protein